MKALTVLELCAFVLSVLLTPVCREIALRLGLVDVPDSVRKRHSAPTARVGGAAVVVSAVLTCCLMAALAEVLPPSLWARMDTFLRLLPATLLICITGLLDDLMRLTPPQKLLGQAAAAGLAVAFGVNICPAWHPAAGALATVLWLVFCSNAVNLIDGVDGLAAGTSAIAAIAMLGGALMYGDYGLACALAALVGAIGGFIAYNVSPASVFLGDSGSLTIGFLLGCYATLWVGNLPPVPAAVSVTLLLAVPLADASFAIVRRLAGRRHIFHPDRRHIHHRLLDLGLNSNRVTSVLCAYSALGAGSALLFAATGGWQWPAVVLLAAFAGMGALGFRRQKEPKPVTRSLSRAVEVRRAVDAIEHRFAQCGTADECWGALTAVAWQFDIPHIRLEIHDLVYEKRTSGAGQAERWNLAIPLENGDLVRVVASFRCQTLPASSQTADTAGHVSLPEPARLAGKGRAMGASA